MLGNMQAMGIEIPPRNNRGRRVKVKPRGPDSKWVRARDHLHEMRTNRGIERWTEFNKYGNTDFGTSIGRLFNAGHFDPHHCEAARIYAEVKGRRDRYHQIKDPKVQGSPKSPSYERGHGTDDEIERRTQNGTINAYERDANRAQKAAKKMDALIVNETARAVLDAVCVYDQMPSYAQIHDLKAQLDIIWDVFKHRYQRQDDGKIRTWSRAPAAPDHPFLAAGEAGVAGAVEGEAGMAEPAGQPVPQ